MGTSVDVILGARSKDFIILEEKFSKFCKMFLSRPMMAVTGPRGLSPRN
jgi:hypothetical protein